MWRDHSWLLQPRESIKECDIGFLGVQRLIAQLAGGVFLLRAENCRLRVITCSAALQILHWLILA